MKKILFFIALTFILVSCLDNDSSSYSRSYTAQITYEYGSATYPSQFNKDSLFIMTDGVGFAYMDIPVIFAQTHSSGSFLGGILMSYLKGEADGELSRDANVRDAWRVHSLGGAPDDWTRQPSMTYAVFHDNGNPSSMPEHDIDYLYRNNGTCTLNKCYVNNTTEVARKVRECFGDDDRMVLKAKGYSADGTVKEAEIVLAQKDTVIYNWTLFELSSLGTVDYVDFEITTTRPEVPKSVCIDNIDVSVSFAF